VQRRIEQIEESVAKYLSELDSADRQGTANVAEACTVRVQEKLENLRSEMQRMQEMAQQVDAAPDKQVSLTDPDARSMKTRGTGMVGYNVQTAVDAQHHPIVEHHVTNVGSDRNQLAMMATDTRTALPPSTLGSLPIAATSTVSRSRRVRMPVSAPTFLGH